MDNYSPPPLPLHTSHLTLDANLRVPQYEDIQDLQAKWPAHVQVAQNTGAEAACRNIMSKDAKLRGPEYEDIEELRITRPSPRGAMAETYTFNQCPAYASSGQV